MRLYKDSNQVSSYSALINGAIIGWVSSSDFDHKLNAISKINYTEEAIDFTTVPRVSPIDITKEVWLTQFEASLNVDIDYEK